MIAQKVFNKLLKKGLTIAFSESMTGGFVSAELVKISGASKVFKGSIIAYQKLTKVNILGISEDLFNQYSMVSEEVAKHMATNVSIKCESDIGVGITGNAGPDLEPQTSDKNAFVAIKINNEIYVFEIDLKGLSRIQSIRKVVRFIYQKLDDLIS